MSKKFIVEIVESKEIDSRIKFIENVRDVVSVTELPETITVPHASESEDVLEKLYWVFDNKRAGKNLSERDCFKMTLRQFIAVLEKQNTELPTLPEVKKVETGILMSPAEICKCKSVCEVNYRREGDKNVFRVYSDSVYKSFLDQRIDLSKHSFPREFYRDIETTWDFSSIPVGSLVEIEDFYNNVSWGKFSGNGVAAGKGHWIGNNHIKSIRIVESGESK